MRTREAAGILSIGALRGERVLVVRVLRDGARLLYNRYGKKGNMK